MGKHVGRQMAAQSSGGSSISGQPQVSPVEAAPLPTGRQGRRRQFDSCFGSAACATQDRVNAIVPTKIGSPVGMTSSIPLGRSRTWRSAAIEGSGSGRSFSRERRFFLFTAPTCSWTADPQWISS
jgi:hypothetical protein